MHVPPGAIPCRQCGSEFLLGIDGPLCERGTNCELFAFVVSVLDQPLNERSPLWGNSEEPRPASPPPAPRPQAKANPKVGNTAGSMPRSDGARRCPVSLLISMKPA